MNVEVNRSTLNSMDGLRVIYPDGRAPLYKCASERNTPSHTYQIIRNLSRSCRSSCLGDRMPPTRPGPSLQPTHACRCLLRLQPADPHSLSMSFPFLPAGLQKRFLISIELFHTANEAGIRGFLQSCSCWLPYSDLRRAYDLFQDIDYCFTKYREGICTLR